MSERLSGRVAFITGAARGQGRSHAVRLAEEGADILAVDLCAQIDSVPYPMATRSDLAETVEEVEARGRRIVAVEADVRNSQALRDAVDRGVAELGRLDIVIANAGIFSFGEAGYDDQGWQDMIDVNLTGVWNTTRAAVPHLIAGGRGGCIVLVSSVAGLRAFSDATHYAVTKHGVVGMMRMLARQLAEHSIRVNSVHPTNVDTPMIQNEASYRRFVPEVEAPSRDDAAARFAHINLMPVAWVDPRDISNAVLFLASDEGRYVTGATLPIDAGALLK
jgi:(+)-trans-carveol dehydrogenase